jgi:hypothetical protein
MNISIVEAIKAINPEAITATSHHRYDVDIATIKWLDGTIEISKEDIKAKQVELQVEYDAQEYARKRKAEYPSIQELVVALYDTEDRAAIDEKRAAVKLKHPKGV